MVHRVDRRPDRPPMEISDLLDQLSMLIHICFKGQRRILVKNLKISFHSFNYNPNKIKNIKQASITGKCWTNNFKNSIILTK